jgi:riboflavin kinase/FMN adenylyltransferase
LFIVYKGIIDDCQEVNMKIFESLDGIGSFQSPVLTIGNYDGIHLGHRQIIKRVRGRARELSGVSMLMTFNPHPLSMLNPGKHLGTITPLPLKVKLIAETGIDVLFVLHFTRDFSLIEPELFVKDVLAGQLGIKGLIVGYDFRFGKGGRGNVEMLRQLSQIHGFFFEMVDAVTLDGDKIGSNRVRKLILDGDVAKVKTFLARPYMIEGTVVRGDGRGKTIGFPTINVETDSPLLPRRGVYITEVDINGRTFHSVTNIGYNPTFGGRSISMESHILDFSEEVYGKRVAVLFHQRIRDEIKFDGVDELKGRIAADTEVARIYFSTPSPC